MNYIFQCQQLTKNYGRIVALRGVTLGVQPGVVGLLGPNGAGKSTLFSVLLGQTPASSGAASVLGLDIRRQQRAIRRRVGFVPENDCLIPGMSGTGYVYFAGRLAGMSHADAMQRTHEVLDYVGMEEARYRSAEQYSTGMKQRLKLAQALVHDPDMLFLDEPTNGMDPQGRQVMLSLISDLGRAGISVIMSSHLLPDVERVCERVVIMGGGEVLTEGRLEEMNKPHPTLYRVEFTGDGASFHRRLTDVSVRVLEQAESSLQIALPEEGTQRLVLQAARDSGARLFGLHPKRSSLEETFMAAIQRQRAP
ncbi:MAG: ABC transporter ATP-binding protein [Planctomycetes bacterium]|nr:ABC transporter ATP-binding protein [Planctomycetota bacterium]MBI3835239.1 ABC transporter ATP-binding protein [Planctomycetota bacterium]